MINFVLPPLRISELGGTLMKIFKRSYMVWLLLIFSLTGTAKRKRRTTMKKQLLENQSAEPIAF